MSSSRLPGKVLKPLAGAPLLQRMLERVQEASIDSDIWVITSEQPEDDAIESLCKTLHTTCYRGHPTDLLDRHYQAACVHGAEIIAKIPSDCPLIDPKVIEQVFSHFRLSDFDYVSNLHPATYPDGNDVEIFQFSVLEEAWHKAQKEFEREHTTPFIWERPERYHIGNVVWDTGLDYSMSHRWTIDYPEDHEFIRTIYDYLWDPEDPMFSLEDILYFLQSHPEVSTINAQYAGVNWYRNHLSELHTITADQTRIIENSPV